MPYDVRDVRGIKPWEIFGGKRPFFLKYADVVADMIKDFKLKPVEMDVRSPVLPINKFKSMSDKIEIMRLDPGIFGGKRFAHLHYKGEVYMLNRDQWQSFTSRIKDDLIQRLKTAGDISLEQLQDLNDAIDPVA